MLKGEELGNGNPLCSCNLFIEAFPIIFILKKKTKKYEYKEITEKLHLWLD